MKESERISQMEKDLKEANRRIVELEVSTILYALNISGHVEKEFIIIYNPIIYQVTMYAIWVGINMKLTLIYISLLLSCISRRKLTATVYLRVPFLNNIASE